MVKGPRMMRLVFGLGMAAALSAHATIVRASPGPSASHAVRAQEVIGRPVHDDHDANAGWVEVHQQVLDGQRVVAVVFAHAGHSVRWPAGEASFRDGVLHVRAPMRAIDRLPRWRPADEHGLERATALFEDRVHARTGGAEIARVKDLLVDLDADRLDQVVVVFDPSLKRGDGWMAVPARLFHAEGGDLRADFDPHGLHARGGPDAARAAKPALPDGRDALLSTLPGRKVHDAHGTELGQVAGAIVDLRSRRLAALLVRKEGSLRSCPLGLGALTIGMDDVRAPPSAASLDDLRGCVPGVAAQPPRQVRARELLKARFADGAGEQVGEVADVVVDADTGEVHYVAGSFVPSWVQAGMVVAMPMGPVAAGAGGLQMHAELMQLARLPVIPAVRLKDAWSPAFARGMDKYLQQAAAR